MNILAVLTPPYIYHGCSTRKTFWEEIFTPVNIKNCVICDVRKHRKIKDGERYITLEIYLDFGSLDKINIKYSEPKYYLVRSGKGLIKYLCIKTIVRSKKERKKGKVCHY